MKESQQNMKKAILKLNNWVADINYGWKDAFKAIKNDLETVNQSLANSQEHLGKIRGRVEIDFKSHSGQV